MRFNIHFNSQVINSVFSVNTSLIIWGVRIVK